MGTVWLACFCCAAAAPGARVFSVAVDGATIPGLEKVDLYKSPGLNTVFQTAHKFILAPNTTAFNLTLTALPGTALGPTISGLELYSILPLNNQTAAATSRCQSSLAPACLPMSWLLNSGAHAAPVLLPSLAVMATSPQALGPLRASFSVVVPLRSCSQCAPAAEGSSIGSGGSGLARGPLQAHALAWGAVRWDSGKCVVRRRLHVSPLCIPWIVTRQCFPIASPLLLVTPPVSASGHSRAQA